MRDLIVFSMFLAMAIFLGLVTLFKFFFKKE